MIDQNWIQQTRDVSVISGNRGPFSTNKIVISLSIIEEEIILNTSTSAISRDLNMSLTQILTILFLFEVLSKIVRRSSSSFQQKKINPIKIRKRSNILLYLPSLKLNIRKDVVKFWYRFRKDSNKVGGTSVYNVHL